MLSCSKRIYMVPHRKIPLPGVTTGGPGYTVQTFFSPLRSSPTCLGLHGRTQRPIAVEPLCSDMSNPLPTVPTVLSGSHPAPLPSVWKVKKQRGQAVLSVICLPSGTQMEPKLPDFFTGRAQCEREAVQ